eukprot:scaffold154169_cov17-Tisochrysis_lutea.AAC.1
MDAQHVRACLTQQDGNGIKSNKQRARLNKQCLAGPGISLLSEQQFFPGCGIISTSYLNIDQGLNLEEKHVLVKFQSPSYYREGHHLLSTLVLGLEGVIKLSDWFAGPFFENTVWTV